MSKNKVSKNRPDAIPLEGELELYKPYPLFLCSITVILTIYSGYCCRQWFKYYAMINSTDNVLKLYKNRIDKTPYIAIRLELLKKVTQIDDRHFELSYGWKVNLFQSPTKAENDQWIAAIVDFSRRYGEYLRDYISLSMNEIEPMIPGNLNHKHAYISIGIASAFSNSSCRPYQSNNNLPSTSSGGGAGGVIPLLNCIEDPTAETPTISKSSNSSRLHTPNVISSAERLKTPIGAKDRLICSCNDSIHSDSSRQPVRSSTHYKEDI